MAALLAAAAPAVHSDPATLSSPCKRRPSTAYSVYLSDTMQSSMAVAFAVDAERLLDLPRGKVCIVNSQL